MKISHSLYELEADAPLNAASRGVKRQGALLKVEFEEGIDGVCRLLFLA